ILANGGDVTVSISSTSATFTNASTITTSNGHALNVSGATFVLDSGTVSGPIQLSSGAALAPGTIPSSNTITLSGATVPGPGLLTNNGTLNLINATVAGPLANTNLLQVVS